MFTELPGVQAVIERVLKNEVSSFVATTSLAQDVVSAKPRVVLPKTGARGFVSSLVIWGPGLSGNLHEETPNL